ncbi:uncharacterized protein TNCV_2200231 [Trichonephila clavipes]|nr:uncharacterized protein TNCV_2200231 [Trichonephila clavipes]
MACRSTRLPSCTPGTKPSGPTIKRSIIDTKNKAWEYFCSTNSNNFGFTFKAAFGKLSSPTNLHQISTGDPASLFHSKVSLLLDSHFPSGSPPIPLVFNDCSPPSCLSPSEVEVVFRKLRGGKAPGIDLIDYAIWKALYNSFPNLLFGSLTSASNLITSLPFLRTQKLNFY